MTKVYDGYTKENSTENTRNSREQRQRVGLEKNQNHNFRVGKIQRVYTKEEMKNMGW